MTTPSNKRGCPTCNGVDPKSCLRCRGKTRLSDWNDELPPPVKEDAMTTPTELAKWLEDRASFERSKLQWNPAADLSIGRKYDEAAKGLRDLAAAQEARERAEARVKSLVLDLSAAIGRYQRAEALAERYAKILDECVITLRHARVFICTREKMHPDGQKLYDELLAAIAARTK